MRAGITTINGEGAKEWITKSILMVLGKTKYKRVLTERGYELVENKDLVPDVSEEQIRAEIEFEVNGDLISGIWQSR